MQRDAIVRWALRLIPSTSVQRWVWTAAVVIGLVPVHGLAVIIDPEATVLVAGLGAVVIGWAWGVTGGLVAGVGAWLILSGIGASHPFAAHDLLAPVAMGASVGLLGTVIKRLDTELDRRQEAEQRLRDTFARVPVGLYRTSWDGEILEVNPAFAEMVGYSVSEMRSMRAQDFYLDPSQRAAKLARLDADGERRGEVIALRHRDGSVVYGRFHTRLVRDANGTPQALEGAVRDVTELLTAEEELRRASDVFRSVFDNAPIGMALSDEEGRITAVNEAIAELLGRDPDELSGLPWIELTHSDDRHRNRALFEELRSGARNSYELEKRFLRPDGTAVWALVRSTVVRNPDGGFGFQLGQVVDITDRKQKAEALEKLVRAKDEFVASVSHELRTPLAVVMGLAEELRHRPGDLDEDEVEELIGLIAEQSSEVANLVEDLLVAARADIGKVSVMPETVDLAQVVGDLTDMVPGAERVETARVEDVAAVADPIRLRQILRNLLTNALRYGGANVEVEVGLREGMAVVEVRDDGPGIPEEDRDRVFQPYERAHEIQGVAGSVGLGLSISRTLARLMDGDLVYERRDGVSCFVLTLLAVEGIEDGRYHSGPVAAPGPTRPRRPVV